MTGIALANETSAFATYDNANRPTGITHNLGMTTLETMTYVLNAVGNRTSMADSAGTTSWTYDNLDRLTQASYPNTDVIGYAYDAVGNRTTHTVGGTPTTNTFDDANRMTASGTTTYGYDANGNQTTRTAGGSTTTYTYDALDRLTGISGTGTPSYAYNGDGLRMSKTVGGATTRFTWDVLGLPQVVAEANEYVWGDGLISQVTGGSTTTYAHADGLGSIRVLTDSTGAAIGAQQYDAFGATRAQSGTQLTFTYTGEQVDTESGLVYLRARYYDPSTGRLLSKDPLPGNRYAPPTQHGYSYAQNSPLQWTDPTGEGEDQGGRTSRTEPDCLSRPLDHRCAGPSGGGAGGGPGAGGVGGGEGSKPKVPKGAAPKPPCCDTEPDPFVRTGIPRGERQPIPLTPNNIGQVRFNEEIIKWGTGCAEALARIPQLTANYLIANGVTLEMAQQWRNFYWLEFAINPLNGSALGRFYLFVHIVELLGG